MRIKEKGVERKGGKGEKRSRKVHQEEREEGKGREGGIGFLRGPF